MRHVLLVVGFAAGCDKTFSILEVRADANGSVSGDVIDADPSCWKPSLTGNEDGDSLIDGCDLCPADPTTRLTDADGDGVDDLCDPHATLQDVVVDFDGFRGSGGWQFVTG